MASPKVTLRDIAQRAGVGDGTVSRVLNNHPNVSADTRARVLRAMEELDYRPNFSARHMRTQQSRLIGFLTDVVATTPFAGQIIQGAQEVAWREGRILMIVNTDNDASLTEAAIDVFLERDVEGIIYAAMSHHVVNLPETVRRVPVALANCFSSDGKLACAVPDEVRGGREATLALLAAGHRRIGLINFEFNPAVPAATGRLDGYREALASYGIAYDERLVYFSVDDSERGFDGTNTLMNLPEPPTALFCINDRTALGAYNALRARGLRIPEDVAVVSFDDQTVITEGLRPRLSSMALPHRQMGQWAAEAVLRQISGAAGDGPPEAALLHCPLVARESI